MALPQRGRHRSAREGGHRLPLTVLSLCLAMGATALLSTPAAAQDEDHSTGGPAYGGSATGPSELPLLPQDPAHPVAAPPVNPALPPELDVVAPWQPNIVCDPTDRPGVEAFAELIGQQWSRPVHSTSRACIDQRSEHYDGRALDWPLDADDPDDRRVGDAAVTWLTADDGAMAARFGIQSIIWNAHSWKPGSGWQGYVGQSAHTDHVHFSFSWDGAAMRTSWWTGVALTTSDLGPCAAVAGAYAAIPQGIRTTPCETGMISEPSGGYVQVRPGGTGPGVDLLQPLLGVPTTGVLDVATREALLAWQSEQGVPQTGVLDQLTYLAATGAELPTLPAGAFAVPVAPHLVTPFTPYQRLSLAQGASGPAVVVLQEALGIEADGRFGPMTAAALREFSAEHPVLPESEETSALLWRVLELRDHPTLPYRDGALAVGDRGPAVVVLQTQLGIEADGVFGPQTAASVAAEQAEAGLDPTGMVDGPTWAVVDGGIGGGAVGGVSDVRGGNVEPWTVQD